MRTAQAFAYRDGYIHLEFHGGAAPGHNVAAFVGNIYYGPAITDSTGAPVTWGGVGGYDIKIEYP